MTSSELPEIIPPYTTGWRLATIVCLVILAVALDQLSRKGTR